ncbi:uncharacterized protein LOC122507178 isoform X2 [Leptopilina heterotoma]|nr:uncharacterized protein LOC122498075 isoform X2 [Leptopilina heterotoma]XP_043475154.1 uncharacterized protein LOC122506851 isoform X2 [Leptopilina heterotoma]XP_043475696.1 uncharacterized protein LOC122507178 isoform X2 [Leptopilina heterotoma]
MYCMYLCSTVCALLCLFANSWRSVIYKFYAKMLYCSVENCKNGTYTKMCQGFSSFRLPKSNSTRRKWLKFAGVKETTKFRICAEHFDKKCFKTFHPRPLLKPDAIPTLHKGKKCTAGRSSKVSSEKEIVNIATTIGTQTEENKSDCTSEQLNISKTPASTMNGENMVSQVELACSKVRNITITETNAVGLISPSTHPSIYFGSPISSKDKCAETCLSLKKCSTSKNLLPLFYTSSPQSHSRQSEMTHNLMEDTSSLSPVTSTTTHPNVTTVTTPSGRCNVNESVTTPSRENNVAKVVNTPSGQSSISNGFFTPSRQNSVRDVFNTQSGSCEVMNAGETSNKGISNLTLNYSENNNESTLKASVDKVTNISPKTLKLNSYKRTIALLRSRINRLKQTKNSRINDKQKTKVHLEKLIKETSSYLRKEAQILFETQLRLSQCKKSGRRYSDELKDLCLSMLYLSPRNYKLLRNICSLPSERTLREYQRRVPVSPGFNKTIMSELKNQFKNQPIENKVVTLLFDEINLVSEIHYDPNTDKFVGVADDGVHRQPKAAKSALVAMISWIHMKAKQPIGYWFLGSEGNSEKTHDIMLLTIDEVFKETGLIVKAIICDQGPRNQGIVTKWDITSKKPYFVRNQHKIFIIFDPPHLLKSLRNNLLTKILNYNGGKISWKELEAVFKLSKETDLNLLPRITEKHFDLGNFSKMRVSLASQIFSESMHTAYKVYRNFLPDRFNETFDATLPFVLDIDRLFDSLNSSLISQPASKKLRYAITENSEHILFLKEMSQKLQTARFEGRQPACLKG